jgi:hypothetical protein
MEETFRTKLQSVGDIFVDKIDAAYSKVKQNFSEATRGVSLTYNIQELQKEKDMLEKRIGRRLAIMRRKNPSLLINIASDAVMKKYFYRLDMLSDQIETNLNERKSRMKA